MKKILMVCTANICRSPYAAATLGARTSRMPGLSQIEISSAGTKALPGAGVCEEVERLLHGEAQLTGRHSSSILNASSIEAADLVLVMDLAQRSEVARIVPSARQRSFTLREAADLARHVRLGPQAGAADGDGSGDVLFRDFVAELHALRGFAPIKTGAEVPFWKRISRAGHDPLDIPDGHNSTYRRHQATLKQVEEATLGLVTALDRLFG